MTIKNRLAKLEAKNPSQIDLPIIFVGFASLDGTCEASMAIRTSVDDAPGAWIERVDGETENEFRRRVELVDV